MVPKEMAWGGGSSHVWGEGESPLEVGSNWETGGGEGQDKEVCLLPLCSVTSGKPYSGLQFLCR